MPSKKIWVGRIRRGKDPETGRPAYHWVGRFSSKRERDAAVAKVRIEKPWEAKPLSEMSGNEVADAFLADYELSNKASSLITATHALKAFRRAFGTRRFAEIDRQEAKNWARATPPSYAPYVVTLGNYAVDELEIVERNPFRGVAGYRSRGRADQPLPDLEVVLDACAVHGDYAPQMRALIIVGALTGMRPGELYALRWGDVDLDRNRITVSRRLYKGAFDTPKNGRTKIVAIAPQACDALIALAAERMTQDPAAAGPDASVFLSKQGSPLSASTLSRYWQIVRAAAHLDTETDFYLAVKHWGVNLLWKHGASTRAIAAQMGWSEKAVDALLNVYGHKDLVALEEIDALHAKLEIAA